MNPSPSFTFLPPPNPTYQFHPQQQQQHPPPSSSATTAAATLSTLKHLIQLCKSTLQSVSNLFPHTTSTPLSTCPFNSHHLVPPQSLFRHYLQCPSSPAAIDLTLLDSLHYPKTLLPVDALVDQNKEFVQSTLPTDLNSEFCFSLDEYPNHPSNFFYTDCPGVVTFPRVDDNTGRILSLPVVLCAECANFKGNELPGVNGFCTGFLPSELWLLMCVVNGWNEFPPSYSPAVVRAILHASACLNCEFAEWVIVNSPLYGVVIDVYIRDHICLLFRLCFKAILREAIVSSLGSCSNGEWRGAENSKCPILVSVLMWLASQMGILYGDVKGKLFVIDMFKQCLLLTLPESLSMFSEEQNGDDILEERLGGKIITKEGSTTGLIFVSQVAAAVAALHERFILEAKIKAIWGSQSLPSHQRASEHGLISKSADEERRKRENYKPIIEHDGFLWQRTNNQEASKNKSREELLAEERDYKRRRMSYRGKKIKRSTTQVMRDIIEEYMEDIKQARGNGHLLPKDVGLASESFALHNISTDDEARIDFPNSSEIKKVILRGDQKESTPDNNIALARSGNNFLEDKKKQKRDSRGHHVDQGHTTGRKRYEQEFYSRHTDGQRGNSPSHEDVTDRRQLNKFRQSRKSHPASPSRDQMQYEHANRWRHEVHENLELRDSRSMSRDRTKRSVPGVHSDFEERYDPSKSCDLDEDGLYLES